MADDSVLDEIQDNTKEAGQRLRASLNLLRSQGMLDGNNYRELCVREKATFDNVQVLDLDGFKGRLLSISYVPAQGEPGSEEMLRNVEEIYNEHQKGGRVRIEYDTKVYYGQL
jgi:hypothetical protein